MKKNSGKVKGFFQKYVSVRKCDTLEEAIKQEKDRRFLLFIAAGAAILYALSSAISFLSFLESISMAVFMLFGIVGFITFAKANEERRRLQRTRCKKCSGKFLWGNVQTKFLRERTSTGGKNNGEMRFSVVHTYKYTCKCDNCGETSEFEWDFLVRSGTMALNGNVLTSRDFEIEPQLTDLLK